MTLRNLSKMVQFLCDGVELLTVDVGVVVTVSIDLGFQLLLRPREWAYVEARQ